MQHNFMPGNVVFKKGYGLGEVIARGASKNRYWVQVLFLDGTRKDFVNKEINTLKRA